MVRRRRKTKHPLRPHRVLATLVVVLSPLFMFKAQEPTALERVQERGALLVLSRNGPTSVYEGGDGLTGFEHSLTKAFADYLQVELIIQTEDNVQNLFSQVGGAKADLSAAGLTVTETRKKMVRFSSPYMEVKEQIIYRTGHKKPEKVEDLIDANIVVIANSSHAERLRVLQKLHPKLRWKEHGNIEMLDLMEMIETGEADYAVIDSNAYTLNRNLYPAVKTAFTIQDSQFLAWAFPKNSDGSLYEVAEAFFEQIHSDGTLAKIEDHYYSHLNEINRSGAMLFSQRIEKRLPQYKPYLQVAADMFGLDWHMLAAISYQESHWNPRAKSPTGVRGFMMLTQNTAKEMGVADRTDVIQSIYGGAKYIEKIMSRLPSSVREPDRTSFALAAYNVGFGHLEDARVLTERFGGNPNSWKDVRKRLPLLAKRKYYKTLKHGYARGWEPVRYVQHIRQFRDILSWNTVIEQRRLASAESGGDFKPATERAKAAGSMSVL